MPSAVQFAPGPAGPPDVPYQDLRLFIAVTSTCCSASSASAARRHAARSTWLKLIPDSPVDTDVRFVLAQPAPEARQASQACPRDTLAGQWITPWVKPGGMDDMQRPLISVFLHAGRLPCVTSVPKCAPPATCCLSGAPRSIATCRTKRCASCCTSWPAQRGAADF